MGRFVIFSSLLLCSLALASCGKSGCKNSGALNYNPDVKFDDGTCRYFAEQFIGTYHSYDSFKIFLADTLYLQGKGQFDFEIKGAGDNAVYFKNFIEHGIGMFFTLSNPHVTLKDSSRGNVIRKEYLFMHDTLFYTVTDQSERQMQMRFGVAIKTN